MRPAAWFANGLAACKDRGYRKLDQERQRSWLKRWNGTLLYSVATHGIHKNSCQSTFMSSPIHPLSSLHYTPPETNPADTKPSADTKTSEAGHGSNANAAPVPKSDNSSALLLRRGQVREGLRTLSIHSKNRYSATDATIGGTPIDSPVPLKPAEEVSRNRHARAGSEDLKRIESTHTPLSNTVTTPGSAKEYEAKRQAMIKAGIVTDFQVLELEKDVRNPDARAEGAKEFLGAGGTASVYAVRLHHAYLEHGNTFAFKQLLNTRNLPSFMKASIDRMQGSNREAAQQVVIQEAKRRIVDEYSHHASVNYIDQIPKVYGLFELDGGLGILMEKVSGPDSGSLQVLGSVAVALGILSKEDYLKAALRAIADTLIPLSEMHKLGLTHGDIKPANVMWSHEKKMFKLLDHGGGRQTGEKAKVFTPGYGELSAKSSRNLTLADPRGDVFQTGQTLHFLLTGKTAGAHSYENGAAISFDERDPLKNLDRDVKDQLAALLNGMICEEGDDRNQRKSAEELLDMPIFDMVEDRNNVRMIIQKLAGLRWRGDYLDKE